MTYVPKIYKDTGGDRQVVASGGAVTFESGSSLTLESGATMTIAANTGLKMDAAVRNLRTRVTTANVNAGATLLAAIAGYKYRLIDAMAIAIGGAAGAVTTVDILGTQTSGVKLVAFAQAALTQSTVLRAGDTNSAVLADGASFVACDANTAITIGKTGSTMTTATHIDIILTYTIEAA